ncbi:DUF3096 domain-containing protein [Candidatus Pacearchaeota archaeon]|nr:DUF3096 domain-containing protein [Candidatus Pacearchaeota archaeon]
MAVITLTLSAILAIIFGIVILIWPRALNMAVALYLILFGVLQFFDIGFDI